MLNEAMGDIKRAESDPASSNKMTLNNPAIQNPFLTLISHLYDAEDQREMCECSEH